MGERSKVSMRYRMDEGLLVACMGAASRFQLFRSGVWKPILAMFIVAFIIGVVFSQVLPMLDRIQEKIPFMSGSVIRILTLLLVFLIGIRWIRRRVARTLLETPSFHGDLQMTLDHSGVVVRTGVSHSVVQWKGVDGVFDLAQGLAFRIGGHTIPVPDTALPEGCSRSALKEKIDAWRKAAQ